MKTGCGANDFIPDAETEDKINILRKGGYYGHPNMRRATTLNESRQCKWRPPSDTSDGDYKTGYTAPLVFGQSSIGSIIEFAGDHFE